MTMEVTPDRLQELEQELVTWQQKVYANKTQVQSLVGKLSFITKCVRPGRMLMARLLNWLREYKSKDNRRIPDSFRKDLRWWQNFMREFNGVRLLPKDRWTAVDEGIATDACLTGMGGLCWGEYFHCSIPDKLANWAINELEAMAILVALRLWAPRLQGRQMLVSCDNMATVWAINMWKTKAVRLQDCVRDILFVCAKYQIQIKAIHIKGTDNRVADWLSRWDTLPVAQPSFREWNRVRGWREVRVPLGYWEISDSW